MMENAGRSLAEVALGRFAPPRVTVLAGRGGNGGGGLAAARHLANWGALVAVVVSHPPEELSPARRRQLDIISRMGMHTSEEPPSADPIFDALIGYWASEAIRGSGRGALIGPPAPAPPCCLSTPRAAWMSTPAERRNHASRRWRR